MSMESFNACVYLVDRQVQAGLGGHLAVTGPAGSLTYAELAARAAELAAGFQAAGVRPEERVLLVATDRPETVITFCALLRMGAIPVPVSTMYRAEELGELVADSRARVVVATPECAAVARAAMHLAPEAATLVLIGDRETPDGDGPRPGWRPGLGRMCSPPGRRPGPPLRIAPGSIPRRSGCTPRARPAGPKAAMHRHGSVARVCETYAHQVLGITRRTTGATRWPSCSSPTASGTRCCSRSRSAPPPCWIRRAPTPAGAAERLAADRPTLFFAGPAFFAALLNAGAPVEAFATVRLATSAGEALPAEIYRRFTEPVRRGHHRRPRLHRGAAHLHLQPARRGTPGHVGDRGARLRGPAGGRRRRPVADGEPGPPAGPRRLDRHRLLVPHRHAPVQVFQGEWLRTGDTYIRSADGFYTCLGRTNDMIKAGGIWVSPMEVEAAPARAPERWPNARWSATGTPTGLEEVVACVVPARARRSTRGELIAFCREGLAAFKRPRAGAGRWTGCRRPPPARSSASWSARWSRGNSARPGSDPCPYTRSTIRCPSSTRRPSYTRTR